MNVVCSNKNTLPNKLYKYYGNIEYVVTALQNKGVYLDNPANFNDPFDELYSPIHFGSATYKTWCTFQEIINFFLSCREYIDNYWGEIDFEYTCNHIFSGDYKWIITINDAVKEFVRISGFSAIPEETIINAFLAKRYSPRINMCNELIGISCFCNTNKSIPMWAYYGKNHSGICVEYDINFLNEDVKNCLQPVCYSDIRDNNNVHFKKSNQWKHEQEWRIIENNMDKKFLPFDCVSGIYLGERFDFSDKSDIKPIWHNQSTYKDKKYGLYLSLINEVKKSNHIIKLYKAEADIDTYNLNFNEFYEHKGNAKT